ncbi:type VII toxin-antitoxin system HepT family RNase toxin, partial [Aeromonas caviae]|uniref:type VII toxin-antitoxin system HepT family RNase toxin n=1 Tax=Aeromonas caviae TaxID=648 RepID=UPI00301455A9
MSRYQAELSEIRAILALRTLSNLEYRAAERILQVSIEASIGVAKHWAKTLAGHTPQDAYQAFEFLVLRGELCPDTLICWSKLIGLRNTLVHDYLVDQRAKMTRFPGFSASNFDHPGVCATIRSLD